MMANILNMVEKRDWCSIKRRRWWGYKTI